MRTIRLGLILLALGCAEPTATMSRPATTASLTEQKSNSYWIDAADRTLYVRLVQVRDESGEPVHAFLRRVMNAADSTGAQRFVVDLRSIAGSDGRLLVPLIRGVLTRDRFARDGGLYVVIGPNSFSRIQNAATLLRQYAHPIFVDHPPGAVPIG
ncbi:MAG TPA: hypothetical protein VGO33_12475 [Gemmatimonadaceae bacterium]|nr:hypothetical protein [Gemmatimonadaceae bacterium]